MKLRFEPDLAHQLQAVAAACDLFTGQEIRRGGPGDDALMADDNGVLANALALPDAQLLHNLRAVQQRNGLEPSAALASRDFTLEMETGTGKTYVYLRTIHELHRRYGFGKFVIVVPSVAIRQGLQQALLATQDHFRRLYEGVPLEHFVYDSAQPGRLRRFATSAGLQVMVLGVGAVNRRALNRVYRHSEQTGGEPPLALIRATRPILIVDEPQSVDGGPGGAGRAALDALGPLCTLRYSATHADLHHPVYRLDAVDAYERRLVKQIEVASACVPRDAPQPPLALPRALIRRTIHEHLLKELQLAPRGIKVLSLFFVDAVARYRDYDAAARPLPGPYARIFEEEFQQAALLPAFSRLFEGLDPAQAAAQAHDGYFSRDRHGRWTEPALDAHGDLSDAASRADAERGWRLILQDKEKLLDLATPLKFIFSHSALKEGWDNPNVFQICVLREMGSERQRRQTLGRGLRLCVDQRGERVQGLAVNRLTVIAGESYEDYAAGLQQELDAAAGPRRNAARLPLRNRDAPTAPSPTGAKAVQLGEDFLDWWGRAGQGGVDLGLENERLLQVCRDALAGVRIDAEGEPPWRKASLALGRDGVALRAAEAGAGVADDRRAPPAALPDPLATLQRRTRLTRRTLLSLLLQDGRLDAFRRDPQGFIEAAAAALQRGLDLLWREGLCPLHLAEGLVCAQPLSAQQGPGALLIERLLLQARPSAPPDAGPDAAAEQALARALERHAQVLRYARLPAGFGLPTPLGSYRPGWVLLLQRGGARQLGFLPAAPAGAARLVP